MRFIDLFAGIGGFRLGMEMAGHKCVGWCEIDEYAQKSYRAMHDTSGEWFAADIRTVVPEELPEADCYCAGFPCQSFSIAGKRGGFEDTRGTLFFEIARIARILKPRYLLLENVKGLLNHSGGTTFATILNTLGELGYWVEWQILNSKDFGVPQNRERVFIVGHFGGEPARKVFPITRTSGQALKELIGGRQGYSVYDSSGTSVTLTSRGGGLGGTTGLYAVPVTAQDRHGVLVKPSHIPGPDDINNTVRAGGRGSLTAKHNHDIIHDGVRIRRLTPLECFRLQGFPDEFFHRAKAAGVSDSQLYKQAGNAVTVNVVYEIAKRL